MMKIFKVEGDSMYPFAQGGDWIIAFRPHVLAIGDLVVFYYEGVGMLLKQITRIEGKGVFVEGKDAMSLDSRVFGLIDASKIDYKVWKVLKLHVKR